MLISSLNSSLSTSPSVSRTSVLVLALLVGWAGSGLAVEAPVEVAAETDAAWYRIELAEQPVGWMVERTVHAGGLSTHESEIHLELRRGGQVQRLALASRFVETDDHRPVEAWSRQDLGGTAHEVRFVFEPATATTAASVVEHSGETSGAPSDAPSDGTSGAAVVRHPWPDGAWLTPGAAQDALERHVARALESPDAAASFELLELDPLLGLEPTTSRWYLERPPATGAEAETETEAEAGAEPLSTWRVEEPSAPGMPRRIVLDAAARVERMAMPLLGLEMILRRVEAHEARAPLDPLEVLARSLIPVARPIEQPRRLRRAVYRVWLEPVPGEEPGDTPPSFAMLPEVGHQTVRSTADGAWRVEVDLDRSPPAEMAPPEALEATRWLDADDPAVVALHERVVATLPPDAAAPTRAEALRRAVAGHVRDKNLGTTFASAGDVARTRSGDCTEHAVLLAALLRADGIPSRLVTGLVYAEAFAGAEHVFVYHLWTQAHVDGRWIDLDATMPTTTAFDATHLALDTSLDAALAEWSGTAAMIGRLRLEVEER